MLICGLVLCMSEWGTCDVSFLFTVEIKYELQSENTTDTLGVVLLWAFFCLF